jgi:hypothetical protein
LNLALRVLITNNALAARGGSELYVRDIAIGLLKRGHEPLVYSTILGDVARELRAAAILVVDNLNALAIAPDVIHGHHHMETMTALLHFPQAPAIHFCHSATSWLETPLRFPRILRYVAVDHACRDRLSLFGIPEEQIRVLLNFVDLDRFKTRETPLPPRPQRALVFSNYANEETHLPAVREACKHANVRLEVLGSGARSATDQPEKVLRDYDLVFAKARCALEALAVGAAVVLCDAKGVGPMVSAREFERLRPLNFGIRTLREPLSADTILREINRYDAADAAAVSQLVRATAGHESIVDELITLYHEVIEDHRSAINGDVDGEGRAAAAYLRQLKIDFANHGAASMRLRERMHRIPLLGRWGIKLARKITGHPDQ